MDPLDRAADRAQLYQNQAPVPAASRALTAEELHRLITHLLGTEMSLPDALHALRLGLDICTMADVEQVMQHVVRCRHCNTWTRRSLIIDNACPACRAEACAPAEELEEN